jgi:inosine-uridine nucleoside N-ribohydrolase
MRHPGETSGVPHACLTGQAGTIMARPILIDCDPGTDDAIALFMALGDPSLDVRHVTVAGGNVGLAHTLRNARALVGLTGRQVPVTGGADRPLLGSFADAAYVHGEDGLGGVALAEGPSAAPGVAADAIRDALRAAGPAGLTLVGIGPATNLALALATEPALAANVAEIVLMTGAWAEGNVTPAAEFNAWSDPEALAVVLACGRPVTLATLDVTAQALCTPARIAALARGSGTCRAAACAILGSMPPSRRLGGTGSPQHDSCAIAWLLAPELFTHRDVHVAVDCGPGPGRGQTVIDRWSRLGRPANARLLETLDADRFFALLDAALSRLP